MIELNRNGRYGPPLARHALNDVPSSFEWFELDEGRNSEQCRRSSFLALFNPDGRPNGWLIFLMLLAACILAVNAGAM